MHLALAAMIFILEADRPNRFGDMDNEKNCTGCNTPSLF
jgi:hypothetical protein